MDKYLTLTQHAIMRYRRRVDHLAAETTIQLVLDAAAIQCQAPGRLNVAQTADAWAVTRSAVFPLKDAGDHWVAVSCFKRITVPKEDRRAMREAARNDDHITYGQEAYAA